MPGDNTERGRKGKEPMQGGETHTASKRHSGEDIAGTGLCKRSVKLDGRQRSRPQTDECREDTANC